MDTVYGSWSCCVSVGIFQSMTYLTMSPACFHPLAFCYAITQPLASALHLQITLQMGSVYLFSGHLSEELLRGIRQLGPGYAFSFEPPQVDSREIPLLRSRDPYLRALSEMDSPAVGRGSMVGDGGGGGSSARQADMTAAAMAAAAETAAARQKLHVAALSGILTPLILLAYNPSVWGGEYFLDNTPDHNQIRWTDRSKPLAGAPGGGGGGGGERAGGGGGGGGAAAGGGTSTHGRVIYSMAGSQAHVFIQPRRAAVNSGGDACRTSATNRPSPPACSRTRGWSGVSSDYNFCEKEGSSVFHVRPRPRPGCMHAIRLPGTRECLTRDVRDALDCLGGVKVLLPLFAQYDHGVRRGARRISYETDPVLNETVLALLAGTLKDR